LAGRLRSAAIASSRSLSPPLTITHAVWAIRAESHAAQTM
jgi:hypothetical protein